MKKLNKINKNTTDILNSNIANKFRSEYNASDNQIIKTEVFVYYRCRDFCDDYNVKSLPATNDVDWEKDLMLLVDYNDYFLRANEDDAVIEVTLDDLVEYLLNRFYKPTVENDYDLQFLFDNLDKKAFVKRLEDNNMGSFVEIDNRYYVFVDHYLFDKWDLRTQLEHSIKYA